MQSGSNQCLKLPREGYTHEELGLLPLWSSRAMVRCIRLRGCHVRAGGRCREIRLSGPLFMLYTPLKHRARCHGFKFSRCTLECRNAEVRGTSTPRRCASCDATTLHDSSDLSEEFETSLCRSAKGRVI